MSGIGTALLEAGLITREDLEKAVRLQQRRGGRLGNILVALGACTQDQVDRVWVEIHVTPALEQALDRASGNRFSAHAQRQIHYQRVSRVETVIEDMLDGARLSCAGLTITGSAVLEIEGVRSLPLEFSVEPDNGFGVLDDASEAMVRRWVAMVDRRNPTGVA